MKSKILNTTIAATFVLTGVSVSANESCHAFTDPGIRLACYDNATSYKPPAESETKNSAQSSQWQFYEKTDEITNKATSNVVLENLNYSSFSDDPQYLILRCDGKGGYETIIGTSGFWGSDRVSVTYKFGETDPITEKWTGSTNNQAAFLPDGYKDFRTRLLSGDYDKVTIRVEDYQGTPHTAVFTGLTPSDKVEFVTRGCQ